MQKGKTKRTLVKLLVPDVGQTDKDCIVKYVRDTGMALFPDSRIFVVGHEYNVYRISKLSEKKGTKE